MRQGLFFSLPDATGGWAARVATSLGGFIEEHKPDLVLSTSPPSSVHLVGLWVQKKYGIPWVADFRDAMFKEPEDLGTMRERVKRPLHFLYERLFLTQADKVIHVTETAKEDARSRVPKAKLAYLPNGYEESSFQDLEPYRKRDRCVFNYTGSIRSKMTLRYFLEGLSRYEQRSKRGLKKIQISLAGSLDKRESGWLRPWVDRGNATVEDHIPYWESLQRQLHADVNLLINTVPVHENGHLRVAGKLYEYLRAGRPILAMVPPGPAADLVQNHQAGLVVPFDNPDAIGTAVERLVQEWEQDRLSYVAPKQAVEVFERGEIARRLCALFDETLFLHRHRREEG